MPIRFRCAYCHQLMGISRRKAGAVVSCPTCQGKVVVPAGEATPDPPGRLPSAPPPHPPPVNAFEQQDFDASVFVPQAVRQPASAVNPQTSGPTNVDYDVQPVLLPSAFEDDTLQHSLEGPSRLYVVVFVVAAFVLAAVAFAAGFVLGKVL